MGFSFKRAWKNTVGDLFSGVAESLGLHGSEYGNRIGRLFNNLSGSSDAAANTYAYSQMGADADMARSVYLWNMQNEYNSPKAQIARMKEAGIDVNPMTYALGSGGMSNTASSISAPSTGGASMSPSGINPISALFSVVSGIADLAIKKETARKMRMANNENERSGTSDATDTDVKKIKQGVTAATDFINGAGSKVVSNLVNLGVSGVLNFLSEEKANRENAVASKRKPGYHNPKAGQKGQPQYIGRNGQGFLY